MNPQNVCTVCTHDIRVLCICWFGMCSSLFHSNAIVAIANQMHIYSTFFSFFLGSFSFSSPFVCDCVCISIRTFLLASVFSSVVAFLFRLLLISIRVRCEVFSYKWNVFNKEINQRKTKKKKLSISVLSIYCSLFALETVQRIKQKCSRTQ